MTTIHKQEGPQALGHSCVRLFIRSGKPSSYESLISTFNQTLHEKVEVKLRKIKELGPKLKVSFKSKVN